jgi:two-component system, chemotaxis family, chemotaxis protein CheY
MKTLIVEDDFTSRLLLQELLKPFGEVHIAVNGREAVSAVGAALEANQPYNLICLDIMMPEMDGHEALKCIRNKELERGIAPASGSKIIMTTALDQSKSIISAFRALCDAYLVKPIDRAKLISHLHQFQLI